jgi:hypothetical protein
MNNRRFPLIIVLTVLLICLGAVPAGAGTGAVQIETGATNIKVGDIIAVSVMASNLTDLYSIDMGIMFDPAKLQAVDASGNPVTAVTPGNIFNGLPASVIWNTIDDTNGKIIYGCRILTSLEGGQDAGIDVTTPQTVATFYLKAVAEGSGVQVEFDPSFAAAEGQGILFSDSGTDNISSGSTNLNLNIAAGLPGGSTGGKESFPILSVPPSYFEQWSSSF